MARNTSYLRRYKDILEEIAEENDMKSEEIERIVDHFFITLKKLITDWRMPKIQITNFGTFKPSIGRIDFVIKTTFRYFKRGNIPRERLVSKIKQIWGVKQRLIKEDLGHLTWNEWKSKEDAEKQD